MKTVCPNCHQKYDVPSESIHDEIKCKKCNENFVVEPAILCTECGTSNSKKDEICFRCGEKLESDPKTEKASNESPQSPPPKTEDHNFTKICPECGSVNSTGRSMCWKCDAKFPLYPPAQSCKTEFPKAELENCPMCKGKISPLASRCPHCGHSKPLEVNLGLGIFMAFVMLIILVLLIICWTSILNPRSSSDVLIAATLFGIITSIAYLGIWLVYLIAALRQNEICKIILLTILPGIGIIVCSFFPSES